MVVLATFSNTTTDPLRSIRLQVSQRKGNRQCKKFTTSNNNRMVAEESKEFLIINYRQHWHTTSHLQMCKPDPGLDDDTVQ